MEWLAIESRLQGRAPEDLSGRDGSRAAIGISREIDDGLGGGPACRLQPFPGDAGTHKHGRASRQGGRDPILDRPGLPDDRRGHPDRESVPVQPASAGGGYADDSPCTLNYPLHYRVSALLGGHLNTVFTWAPRFTGSVQRKSRAHTRFRWAREERIPDRGLPLEPTHARIFFLRAAIAKMSRQGGESTGPVVAALDKRVR